MQDAGYKECGGCNEVKPFEKFYRDRKRTDGRQTRCKRCQSSEGRAWRLANKAHAASLGRRWDENNREKRREKAREWRKANPGKATEHAAKARRRNPEKVRARKLVHRAIERGTMQKPHGCSLCGKEPPERLLQAHHPDYSKPLDVEWLCPRCHGLVHRKELDDPREFDA